MYFFFFFFHFESKYGNENLNFQNFIKSCPVVGILHLHGEINRIAYCKVEIILLTSFFTTLLNLTYSACQKNLESNQKRTIHSSIYFHQTMHQIIIVSIVLFAEQVLVQKKKTQFDAKKKKKKKKSITTSFTCFGFCELQTKHLGIMSLNAIQLIHELQIMHSDIARSIAWCQVLPIWADTETSHTVLPFPRVCFVWCTSRVIVNIQYIFKIFINIQHF